MLISLCLISNANSKSSHFPHVHFNLEYSLIAYMWQFYCIFKRTWYLNSLEYIFKIHYQYCTFYSRILKITFISLFFRNEFFLVIAHLYISNASPLNRTWLYMTNIFSGLGSENTYWDKLSKHYLWDHCIDLTTAHVFDSQIWNVDGKVWFSQEQILSTPSSHQSLPCLCTH